jgi:hypothetical protein
VTVYVALSDLVLILLTIAAKPRLFSASGGSGIAAEPR